MTIDIEEAYKVMSDQYPLYYKSWIPEQPKGIIHIHHGLCESIEYYEEFAKATVEAGFATFIYEARGHGRTWEFQIAKGVPLVGDIGEGGFERLRQDLLESIQEEQQTLKDLPVFLIGHSLGATISLNLAIEAGNDLKGLILIGIKAPENPIYYRDLLAIIEAEIIEKGELAPSEKAFNILFEHVNDTFQPVKTPLDWITSDSKMIASALKLPYTNVAFNNRFYRDYIHTLRNNYEADQLKRVPKDLNILLLSGDRDVVTDFGEGIIDLAQALSEDGREIVCKLYENKRHSLLREVNRKEVTKDILKFIKEILNEANIG